MVWEMNDCMCVYILLYSALGRDVAICHMSYFGSGKIGLVMETKLDQWHRILVLFLRRLGFHSHLRIPDTSSLLLKAWGT